MKKCGPSSWKNFQEHSSSMCAQHSLLQFKVVHCAHPSKSKLAKISPQINPTCDRCKSAEATLIHVFWLCPNLENYWRIIFEALSTVLLKLIQTLFWHCSESFLHLPVGGPKVVAFTALTACRLILFRWKDAVPPLALHWTGDVLFNLKLEKIRYTIQGSEKKFMVETLSDIFDKPSTQLQE